MLQTSIATRTLTAIPLPKGRSLSFPSLPLLLLCLVALCSCRGESNASEGILSQKLEVVMAMADRSLEGRSVLTVNRQDSDVLLLSLAPQAAIDSVRVNDRQTPFDFRSGRLRIDLSPFSGDGPLKVGISYRAHFDDPFPDRPVVTDNPGYGVTGTITNDHAFLLAGSGWYPHSLESHPPIRVTVEAPRGMLAVTSGRLVGHRDSGDVTRSEWAVEHPVGALALSVGSYRRQSRVAENATVATYLFPGSQDLSDPYLEATEEYIRFYSGLHGPYAYPKFAVVENFFPTGYSFASYTLIGSRVLRLPFIIDTSLRHEVAHCWWGNGVFVAPTGGNWSEGLSTYVADYLAKEESSPADARDYRLQILRDYSRLVPPEEDFPLSKFSRRTSPASRAIGYGKSAFVIHMLRQRMGDEAFWSGLRRFYGAWLFKEASWPDLLASVASPAQEPFDPRGFQEQWIDSPGAPELRLDHVRSVQDGPVWTVSGRVVQEGPPYDLRLPVRLETGSRPVSTSVVLNQKSAAFELKSPTPPKRLLIDPEVHVFRRLSPGETPLSVNSVKGSEELTAILSSGYPRSLARTLLAGLNHPRSALLDEQTLDPAGLKDRDLLFLGTPRAPELRSLLHPLPEGVELQGDTVGFSPELLPRAESSDSFFITLQDPEQPKRVRALMLHRPGTSLDSRLEAVRKITHYGRYSLLAFADGTNRASMTWEPAHSPLVHVFSGDGK